MIEQPSKKKMLLFAGSSNPELAEKVAGELGTSLALVDKKQFASGEIYIRLQESARGADCFVMQSHSGGVNFTIMEQLLLVDALKRASAKRITAVLPFYPYSRQDKKALPREPISARLIGDLFVTAGADRLVSIDLHTQQIQGFIDEPFDHLTALPLFVNYFKDKFKEIEAYGLDFIFGNDDEFTAFVGADDLDETYNLLQSKDYTSIMTMGEEGSAVVNSSEIIKTPRVNIEAVDTNGAGDMFAGSFMFALLQDHNLKVCAEFANFGAARVVETFGPRLTKNGYQETLKSFQKS